MVIETSRNILHPCQCGCETPVIQESVRPGGHYRVVCPVCKNEDEGYFIDSLEGTIMAWNNGKWKWDDL